MKKYKVIYQIYVMHEVIEEVEALDEKAAMEEIARQVNDGSLVPEQANDYVSMKPNVVVYNEDEGSSVYFDEDDLPN